jgi:aspartate racemase
MSILGLVGGIAPPSTIAYYRSLLEAYQARTGRSLRLVVDSVDTAGFFELLQRDDRPAIVATLLAELHRLAAAGADLAIIGSNAGHTGFDEVRAASPVPLVSIVEATAERLGDWRRVGLLAATNTIRADVYGPTLAARGITVATPPAEEQERVQAIYFGELVDGRFLPGSRHELLTIADRLRTRDGAQAIILGGTELPLILTEPDWHGLPLLDSGRIHAEAAVDALIALETGAT